MGTIISNNANCDEEVWCRLGAAKSVAYSTTMTDYGSLTKSY